MRALLAFSKTVAVFAFNVLNATWYEIGVVNEYYGAIKDITFIPDTEEIKIEFMYPGIYSSGTGIDMYKLSKTLWLKNQDVSRG
jgi:hypothetical protein